jgi:adenylosuccinate lyase
MISKLVVYPDRMAANIESLGGVVHSGEVLLALAKAGLSREDAYRIVQRNAMATWTKLGTPGWQDLPPEPGCGPRDFGPHSPPMCSTPPWTAASTCVRLDFAVRKKSSVKPGPKH